MTIQNVVLVGAGGNIGQFILDGLTKAGFNLTILSRKSSKSEFPGHKVVTVGDDYPHAELVAAFKGQDAVVSTMTITPNGKIDASGQFSIIDAAIEAGVRRYVPSEYGADHRNERAVELSDLIAEKHKVVEYLKAKGDKIEFTSVFTGPFADFDLKIGFNGIDLKNRKALITEGGSNMFSVATMAQVGEGVAAVLKHDKETANQYVVVESYVTTQNENLRVVEKLLGSKFTVEHQTGQALIEGSRAGMQAGNFFSAYGMIQAALFIPGYGADMSAEGEKWRSILRLKELDPEEETRKVLVELGFQR